MNILINILKKYKNKKKANDYNNEQRLIKRRLFKTVTTTMEELDRDLSNIFKKG